MKNLNEIREIMCDEIDKIRDGKTTPANVNAIVNATGKYLTTIKMQMEYAKLTGRQPNMDKVLMVGDTISDSPKSKK